MHFYNYFYSTLNLLKIEDLLLNKIPITIDIYIKGS